MQVKLVPFRLLFVLLMPAIVACDKPQPAQQNKALLLLTQVQPNSLYLGARTAVGAERCVYAVTVIDSDAACAVNDCDIQAFYWPVKAVQNGQRAVLVSECSTDGLSGTGHLLTNQGPTGDSGILVFQSTRDGNGLWKNVTLPTGDYAVQFATEAAEGTLSFHSGNYHWEENPD